LESLYKKPIVEKFFPGQSQEANESEDEEMKGEDQQSKGKKDQVKEQIKTFALNQIVSAPLCFKACLDSEIVKKTIEIMVEAAYFDQN
jgi:hypothetical protein